MLFGGKIDDEARIQHVPAFKDIHPPNDHLARMAGSAVGREHVRVFLLELQGDAFAHDAFGVHGVHQGFNIGFQQIAFG